ncbi:helix-turn-helix domain-containing protein [Acidithiobacillus marinus]|uniref:Helix-turn-helix domain-containing protein n=1 Tax=Acidithiobacillus marinus TaxID=187490 RepID=A0A2I1DJR2_9PROT|nr:helix-turn-helix domain-containing protein [Acidithiobacillus marinus]
MDDSQNPPDLRSAREARGWTLRQAAAQLHITEIQVQGLEEGNYSVLPGATFARGFLKNYARILGLDPEPLLRSYDASNASSALSPTRQLLPDGESPLLDYSKRTLLISFLIVVAVVVAVWWFWGRSGSAVMPSSVTAPPEKSHHRISKPVTLTTPALTVASGRSVTADLQSGAAAAIRIPSAPTQSVDAAHDVMNTGIAFQFSANCWVQVKDAEGKTLLAVLGRPGDLFNVHSGKPPYQVLLGNARGVKIQYQGKPVTLSVNARGVDRLQLGTAPTTSTSSAAVTAAPPRITARHAHAVPRHSAVSSTSLADIAAPSTPAALAASAPVISEASHAP